MLFKTIPLLQFLIGSRFHISQFIWAELVNKHIYRGDIIRHSHCHFGSRFICPPDWEYAGISNALYWFLPYKLSQ